MTEKEPLVGIVNLFSDSTFHVDLSTCIWVTFLWLGFVSECYILVLRIISWSSLRAECKIILCLIASGSDWVISWIVVLRLNCMGLTNGSRIGRGVETELLRELL